MKTTLLLLFVAAITAIQNVEAQTASTDSAKIAGAAKRDASRFRLNRQDYQKCMTEHFPAASDYFKPSASTASNTALLNDSLYIQTYRTAAFYSMLDQRNLPTLHDSTTLNHNAPAGIITTTYTTANEQIAQNDARKFSLPRDLLKKFKKAPFPPTSDYFTPTAANASNPALLTDSAYVKTFRFEAFNKTFRQRAHPVRHAILIAGIITVGVVLLVVAVAASYHLSFSLSGL